MGSFASENGLWVASVFGLILMVIVPLALLWIAAKRRPYIRGGR